MSDIMALVHETQNKTHSFIRLFNLHLRLFVLEFFPTDRNRGHLVAHKLQHKLLCNRHGDDYNYFVNVFASPGHVQVTQKTKMIKKNNNHFSDRISIDELWSFI